MIAHDAFCPYFNYVCHLSILFKLKKFYLIKIVEREKEKKRERREKRFIYILNLTVRIYACNIAYICINKFIKGRVLRAKYHGVIFEEKSPSTVSRDYGMVILTFCDLPVDMNISSNERDTRYAAKVVIRTRL